MPEADKTGMGALEILAVSVLLAALTVYFTWPLAIAAPDHLVNLRDPMFTTFVVGHGVRALATDPLSYFDGRFFYPYDSSIAYSDHFFLQALLAAPIVLASGNPVLGNNLMLLLGIFLSGLGTYILARDLSGSRGGALVAAVIFAFSSFRYTHRANLQIHWIALLPFALVFLHRYLRSGKLRHLVFFALALALQVLAAIYYAAFAYMFVALAVVLLALVGDRTLTWKKAGALCAVGLIVFVLTLPFHIPYVLVHMLYEAGVGMETANAVSSGVDVYLKLPEANRSIFAPLLNSLSSAQVAAYFPGVAALALAAVAFFASRGRLAKDRVRWLRIALAILAAFYLAVCIFGAAANFAPQSIRNFASALASWTQPFVALPLVVLAGVFASRQAPDGPKEGRRSTRRTVIVYGAAALIFFFISLGPQVSLGEVPMGRGIYFILHLLLPPLRAVRYVPRFAVVVVMSLALMAAFGCAELTRRAAGRTRWPVLVPILLMLFLVYEYGSGPMSLTKVPGPMPDVYRWLGEQPGDFAVLELPFARAAPRESIRMRWSLIHGKRLVNGYSGWGPPLYNGIQQAVRFLPAGRAIAHLRRIPFRYLLVHQGQPGMRNQALADGLLRNQGMLRFVGWFGGTAVFENRNTISGQTAIRIYPTRELRGAVFGFEARRLSRTRGLRERLSVTVDGETLATFRLRRNWRHFEVEVPPARELEEVRQVEFRYSYRPEEPTRNEIPGLTDSFPADLSLRAASRRSGNISRLFSTISVDGRNLTSFARGYNLLVINPQTGNVIDHRRFDTRDNPGASHSLAEFIRAVPEGHYVAGITCYYAGRSLTPEAAAALRSLGCLGGDALLAREARNHAFVGRKGAAPGTALEATGNSDISLDVGRDQEGLGFRLRNLELRRSSNYDS